jgi:large subunit ribosomal protein L2
MGKNLIQQARGKGGPTYRAPSFRYKGEAKHTSMNSQILEGEITEFVHCAGHSAPLARIEYNNGESSLTIAAEGLRVGQKVQSGPAAALEIGNTAQLSDLPEGTLIYNIEGSPGDGGKFVRASGTFARIVGKVRDQVVVLLPSKKKKTFCPTCRASIGIVAGGGRPEKPIMKAGVAFYKNKAKNKLWPIIGGSSQNAVDHPFGNKRTLRKSKARPIARNAPPGRKVGMIAARRTGRKKKS